MEYVGSAASDFPNPAAAAVVNTGAVFLFGVDIFLNLKLLVCTNH